MEKYEAYFSSHYPPPYGFPWDFPLPPPLSVDEFVIDLYIYIFVNDFYIIKKLFFSLIDF
jgi:hypothetical protein